MISIIIVNFQNPPLLRLCLKSLLRVSAHLNKEVIVVDSASSVETKNVVTEEFPEVRLIPFKENIGYTRGVNEGLKAAQGQYCLILNPDIIPLENSIDKLLEFAKNNPQAGLIGPRLLNFDGSPQQSCFRFYKPITILYRRSFFGKLPWAGKELRRFLISDKELDQKTEVDWLMGSALLANKEAIEKTGLMDEGLFLYMSEVDWAWRFWENGYKVFYFPEAQMYHYHRRTSKAGFGILDLFLRRESRWHLKDAIRYFQKHGTNPHSHI